MFLVGTFCWWMIGFALLHFTTPHVVMFASDQYNALLLAREGENMMPGQIAFTALPILWYVLGWGTLVGLARMWFRHVQTRYSIQWVAKWETGLAENALKWATRRKSRP